MANAGGLITRRAVDVADTVARGRFLDETLTGGKALVLTEGLLLFLTVPTVTELANDLDRSGITWCTAWPVSVLAPSLVIPEVGAVPALSS